MAPKPKCIIILSTKSAGSSALQELVCRFGGGRHVEHTRHAEQETLYWTKAASILGLPQLKLPDSEVPIPPGRADKELRQFLKLNAPDFSLPNDPKALIHEGWRALTLHHGPVFVEKSPHHLHQWSCLELMAEAANTLTDLDFRFIGLVRNPMDVLYSAWSRWRTRPEDLQEHWRTAYENLERFSSMVGTRLNVVRYEDFAEDKATASRLLEQLGLASNSGAVDSFIHGSSRMKWKADEQFGFVLSNSVAETAERFGYTTADIQNQPVRGWTFYSSIERSRHKLTALPRKRLRQLARKSN